MIRNISFLFLIIQFIGPSQITPVRGLDTEEARAKISQILDQLPEKQSPPAGLLPRGPAPNNHDATSANHEHRQTRPPPVDDLVHPKSRDTLASCRADYPELLARVDAELRPWSAEGISRSMIDNLWLCNDHPSTPLPNARRFQGFFATIRGGKVSVEQGRDRPLKRIMHMTSILKSVAATIELPDCDLVMMCADHVEQGLHRDRSEPVSAPWSPRLAPMLLAYRLQRDNGTVAVPGAWILPLPLPTH